MAQLLYKTAGGDTAQGKERVLFLCHPDDHMLYFENISRDIFQTQDCAIYYYEPHQTIDADVFEWERMQLFVLPVTQRFLTEANTARDVILEYAKDRGKPILPILQEDGLTDLFNTAVGERQFLDRRQTAAGAVSYAEKLSVFLSSVLVGNDLTPRIRAAFEAYIFLSYRKKDRVHAMEVIRNIHAKEKCLDVAVWYDEFLTPGENFNETIRAAMQNSKLFMLLITPNLLEENNYVMAVEYPMALKAKMPIVAVETLSTDRERLAEKFPGLPPIVDGNDPDALAAALDGYFTEEDMSDPWHLYYMGLAYLNGVDVEPNADRAETLLKKAAEQGVFEASEKVAEILFKRKKDFRDCLSWMEAHRKTAPVSYRYGKIVQGGFVLPCTWTHSEIRRMVQELFAEQNREGAQKILAFLLWVVYGNRHHYAFDLRRELIEWYLQLAKIDVEQPQNIPYYYANAQTCADALEAERFSANADDMSDDLVLAHVCVDHADCLSAFGKERMARKYRKRAKRISKKFFDQDISAQMTKRHAHINLALAKAAWKQARRTKANTYCIYAVCGYENVLQEKPHMTDCRESLCEAYELLIDLEQAKKHPRAVLCYAYRVRQSNRWEDIPEKIFSALSLAAQWDCRKNLACAYERLIPYVPIEEKQEIYEKELEVLRQLVRQTKGAQGQKQLAAALLSGKMLLEECDISEEYFVDRKMEACEVLNLFLQKHSKTECK